MCGFAAFFERGRNFPQSLLRQAGSDLLHRGPDSAGLHVEDGAAIVFRRLSIIDPDARSDQPLSDRSGRYVLAFNGEIYNYRQLRAELAEAGVPLRTQGDSEVIVEGFARWGESLFEKLEGMFAIILFDTRDRRVWAARDPLGIKPLYFARSGQAIGFASEMRPLRRFLGRTEVDPDALAELLVFRFAAGRLSNLKDIELLPGGMLLRFDLDGAKVTERRFADVAETFRNGESIPPGEAEAVSEQALMRSVEDHLQSDVGYAVQLSGGVDSSLVLALAASKTDRRVDSYGIALPDTAYDESRYRTLVVERYKPAHTEVALGAADFADALPRAVAHMEGPTPHFGCVMLMLLCRRIRERHKVVLTGEGADEFFGGYERYARWRELRRFGRIARLVPDSFWPLLKRYSFLRRFSRHDPAIVASVYFDFLGLQRLFPGLLPRPGARETVAGKFSDFRDRMLAVDQASYLSSLLMRQDRMAMAESVEARVPFAHFPLAKILNRLPRSVRVPGGETKPLLKAIARRWLPGEVVDRRKVGLTLPLGQWLQDGNGLGRYLQLLAAPDCRLAAWAEAGALRRLVDEVRRGPAAPGLPPVMHLINIELWLRSLEAE